MGIFDFEGQPRPEPSAQLNAADASWKVRFLANTFTRFSCT
jgi:hypothetical protein